MKRYVGVLVAIVLFLCSCKNEPPQKKSINGVWKSEGSSWILEIKDSTDYSFYDVTAISCLPRRQGKLDEILEGLSFKGDTLSLLEGVVAYNYTRIKDLPKDCHINLDKAQAKNPIFNFEVFAQTVKQHYAFLELNNINWDSLYKEQKGKLNENSTDAELYLILEETLERLKDNHAFLEANEEVYEVIDKMSEPEEEMVVDELPEYGDFQVAQMVVEHHLEEEMTEDSWLIQWGKLNKNIGYIQVKAMWLFADLELPKKLIDEVGYVDAYVETFHKMYEGDYVEKEIQGVRKIMDRIMKDLSNMESIIIDVRFNGGGQDAVSFEILSRFTAQKIQVATQQLKYGDQLTPVQSLHLKGTKDAFKKPVYILTSPQTGSAAEAFSIATRSMKNIKRIGSATSGAMSTALEKTLPNGWAFAISNEIYMDNDGKCYENIGVPVDHELNFPKGRQPFFRSVAQDLEADKQNILEAIKILKGQEK